MFQTKLLSKMLNSTEWLKKTLESDLPMPEFSETAKKTEKPENRILDILKKALAESGNQKFEPSPKSAKCRWCHKVPSQVVF